ncbi:hypothetical protein AZ14_1011, partial [Bordetella bronchiseptica 980]
LRGRPLLDHWGEHSEAILAELGYQPADLERLRAQGVF